MSDWSQLHPKIQWNDLRIEFILASTNFHQLLYLRQTYFSSVLHFILNDLHDCYAWISKIALANIIYELSPFICYACIYIWYTKGVNFHSSSCMADSLSMNCIKVSSVSNMLILTYFGLAPNCLPLRVIILCPLRKVSQSSTSPSHFNHTKAASRYNITKGSKTIFIHTWKSNVVWDKVLNPIC